MSTSPPSRVPFLRLTLTLPVLVGALWLVFARTDPSAVLQTWTGVDLPWLLASLAVMTALIFLRLGRWALLVRAVADVPAPTVGRVGLIGYMAIDLLPLRSGEFVRPFLLQRQGAVPFGAGMATCVVERVMDLVAVLALLLTTLAFADLPSMVVTIFDRPVDLAVQGRNAVLAAALVFGLPGVLLVLAGERGESTLRFLLRPLPAALGRAVLGLSIAYRDATRAIGRPRLLLQTGLLTGLGWVLNAVVQWALMEAFGLHGFGFFEVGFLSLVVAISLMLPSPAAGLGVFEAGTVAGLMIFSVEPSLAAGFAVALHAVHAGVITVLGLLALAAEGLRFSDMWRRKAPDEITA